jgi:hypothetical protein
LIGAADAQSPEAQPWLANRFETDTLPVLAGMKGNVK